MTAPTRLLTCVQGALETRVVELVRFRSGLEVARRCADLADVLAAAAAGQGTVVLLSSGLPGLDRAMTADLRRRGVALLGVHDAEGHEADQIRQWFAATGVESVHRVDDAAGLEAAVYDLRGHETPGDDAGPSSEELWRELEAPAASGSVVAVWGPVGAPGRSTIAVTLAARLARGGRRVLLVDADTYGASLAQMLGVVDETPGLPAACRLAHGGVLSGPALAALAPRVPPGLQILTGIPTAQRWAEITESGMEQVLSAARRMAEVTVVDTGFCLEETDLDGFGPRRNGATLAGLTHADAVVAVGGADPVGLSRLVRGSATLREVTEAPVVTVANRVRRAVVGSRVSEQIDHLMADPPSRVVCIGEDPGASTTLAVDGCEALAKPGRGPLADGVNEVASRLVGMGVVRGRGGSGPARNGRRFGARVRRRDVAGVVDVVDSSV